MQQPISGMSHEFAFHDFVSQNLVNWFLNPVSKVILSLKMLKCGLVETNRLKSCILSPVSFDLVSKKF